jgi:hypothetical protein
MTTSTSKPAHVAKGVAKWTLLLAVIVVISYVTFLLSDRVDNRLTHFQSPHAFLSSLLKSYSNDGDMLLEEDVVSVGLHSVLSSSESSSIATSPMTMTARRGLAAADVLPGVDLALAIKETQKSLSLMYNRYEVNNDV